MGEGSNSVPCFCGKSTGGTGQDTVVTVSEYDIQMYKLPSGKVPFESWLLGLRDSKARARIRVRIDRMQTGNFADHRSVGKGVYELRVDYGPGYRVYYARAGKRLVLLLAGGDKSSQRVDIETAIAYWKDYKDSLL